ncbi:MAG: type II toxin-antitoxin system Phd/YefM family antitoxin [Nitrospirae bacterium]|nr:type II toxin-antitoxin system Phd/YefM family antitoxin [Nitrospirota bacterium]
MTKIKIKDLESIPATKAKTLFGDILHQTSVEGKRFVVNRQGKPVAVILSYREYCELIEANNSKLQSR